MRPTRSRLIVAISLLALAAVAAGCSSGAVAPPTPTAAPSVTPSAPAGGGPRQVAVNLTDTLRIEPATIEVKAGEPVRFVVTNLGALDHEFYLGDAAAQDEHAMEMRSMAGMAHDEEAGIGLKPGETRILTFTFMEPGAYLAGCHVNSHFLAGMKAAITVR